jgi:hypothetical protein
MLIFFYFFFIFNHLKPSSLIKILTQIRIRDILFPNTFNILQPYIISPKDRCLLGKSVNYGISFPRSKTETGESKEFQLMVNTFNKMPNSAKKRGPELTSRITCKASPSNMTFLTELDCHDFFDLRIDDNLLIDAFGA